MNQRNADEFDLETPKAEPSDGDFPRAVHAEEARNAEAANAEAVNAEAIDRAGGTGVSLGGRLVLIVFALLGPACLWWVRPPAALAEDAPALDFSAGRAARHLEWLAEAPRPAGSEQNRVVRERLIEELAALGLEVEVQTGVRRTSWGLEREVSLVNVLGRLRGRAGERTPGGGSTAGRSVLLLAHFDSVAAGPGAADDACGVAAILETLRALRASGPLERDLLVLITDGEEDGLLGARLFVEEQHPWLGEVSAVLNVEARGAGGPSILFQVGPRSSALVELYRRLAPHPFGTSLGPAIFEKMPNDTDFTIFIEAGKPGLNFAFVGGGAAYHTAGDTLKELDLGSLQQQGEALLSLARGLGQDVPGNPKRPLEQEFLFLPGLHLVYPKALTAPLSIALALGCLGFLVLRGSGPGSESRAGWLATLCGALGAASIGGGVAAAVYFGAEGLSALAGRVVQALGMAPDAQPASNFVAGEWLAAGAWIGGVGCVLLVLGLFGRGARRVAARRRLDALGAGALLLLAPAAVALAVLVPGGGHVGLLALIGTAGSLWWAGPRRLVRGAATPDHEEPASRSEQGSLAAIGALVAWSPAGIALLPLLPLFIQLGSVERMQERVLAAGVGGLALLSALPVLAVVGARREKLACAYLFAGALALVVYAYLEMGIRLP